MISAEGEVKITDFGIAKARNLMSDREGEILMGKAQYMSPEQAQYKNTDRRSDIFSLGVVMYELLTGRNVFGTTENTTMILDRVVSQPISPPRQINTQIPDALERIMMKALERGLDKRYQDAGRMGYDLEYFMYHKGYGPTIVTLEKYMRQLFPHLYVAPGEEVPEPKPSPVSFEELPTQVENVPWGRQGPKETDGRS
jgi:serine/threonine-protein kinase